MTRLRALAVLGALLFLGCGSTTPEPVSQEPPRDETTVEVIREEPPPEGETGPEREPALVKGTSTPLAEGQAPEVRISAPRNNSVLKQGPFKAKLAVKGWPTAPGGPYVAVAVDDQPPIRVDDPAQPIELGDLAEGSHLLRAYAVRLSGESVKEARAFAWTTFHVRSRTPDWGFNPQGPLVTLNQPAGTYEGDPAAAILLDCLVQGATLGASGHKLKITVGTVLSGEATENVPHHLHDLPDGPNEVVVELLDASGAVVPGPFARASRTITVQRAATAPAEPSE